MSQTVKMKVSRTFSLPVDVLQMIVETAGREDINESEACRRLIRAGIEETRKK